MTGSLTVPMNLGDTIRHGVKWLFLGNTGNHVLHFAFGIALARLLAPADFGAIVTIQVFTGFLYVLASGGMGQSLIRARDATDQDFHAVFTMQLVLGVLIYISFFLFAPYLAVFYDNPLYGDLLRVSAIGFLMKPFGSIRMSWLNRAMDFKRRSVVELSTATIAGASSVAMAFSGMGVWSLVFSGLVGGLITNVLLTWIVPLRPRLHWQIERVRAHSGYGLKITINEFMTYLKEQAINLILSKSAGPAFLGLFNRAESIARMPNRFITPATGQVVFRAMSKVQDDIGQTKYMYYRTITLLTVYIWPFLLGLIWVAEPLIELLYGKKWLAAVEPARIIAVAGFVLCVGRPSSVLIAAQNRLNQEMAVQTATLVFAVAACLIGLRWGLRGVAVGVLLTQVLSTALLYAVASRIVPTRLSDLSSALGPALKLNGLLAVALALLHFGISDLKTDAPAIYLLAMSVAGGAVYACAFLFLPIPALRTEAERWRQAVRTGLVRLGMRSR